MANAQSEQELLQKVLAISHNCPLRQCLLRVASVNAPATGISLATIIALIRKEVDGAQANKNGKPGKDGAQGPRASADPKVTPDPLASKVQGNDGKRGKPGKDGADGEDGVGIERIEQDVDDAMVIHMTDGTIYH